MTDGKIEATALKTWQEKVHEVLDKKKTDVAIQAHEKLASLLSGDDTRIKPVTQEQLDHITLSAAQAWLENILKTGPIEAAIVGDIPQERALELAKKYLGALPKREVADKELDALRRVTQNAGPLTATLDVDTITPKAYVITGWRGADWANVKDRRVLQLAAGILSIRIRQEIREKRGLAYSPYCVAMPARAFSGTGLIAAKFDTGPEKAAAAATIASDLLATFAQNGPTDQELDDARKQFKNDLETKLKEPGYWAAVLGDLDYHNTKLSDVKEVLEKFTTYTKEDVLDVMKRYTTAERQVQVIATPLKKESSAEAPKEK
jgi:zinc protease